jgi:hypothetical protein
MAFLEIFENFVYGLMDMEFHAIKLYQYFCIMYNYQQLIRHGTFIHIIPTYCLSRDRSRSCENNEHICQLYYFQFDAQSVDTCIMFKIILYLYNKLFAKVYGGARLEACEKHKYYIFGRERQISQNSPFKAIRTRLKKT